jgi:outer membrane protein assembly factor BamB
MEGPGSSPILWEDLLIFHVDGGDVQYVVALHKETGKTAWRRERSVDLSELPPDFRKAYSTPIVVQVEGAPQLVSSAARATYGYDPRTGEELWRLRHGGFSMSSRPVHAGGVVYLNTGFMQPELWALRLGGSGELDPDRVAWRLRKGLPTMPSPVLHAGHLYLVSDTGTAVCLDAETGEQVWRQRLGGEFSASPVLAAGRLYFCDRSGRTTVIAAQPEYERLAVNELDAGCMASPVVPGDALLLRTKTHLYRVER